MADTLETFATVLRQSRRQRHLSLEGLARKVGVTKASLSHWEHGRARPSTTELESLIGALALPDGEALRFRRLMERSRALASLDPSQRPPLTGGLLRALRLRRCLTQSEVAHRLQIRQGTLAKWEKSEDWPSAERLCALCQVLGARPEESEAILQGVFLPLPLSPDAEAGAIHHYVDTLIEHSTRAPCDPLLDLRFLELDALLWLRGDVRGGEVLRWKLWSHHALFLHLQDRDDEARIYIQRLERIAFNPENAETMPLQVAVIHKAKLLRKQSLTQALGFLQDKESLIHEGECRAWYWMYLGELLVAAGRPKEAQQCIDRSNAIPHPEGERIATYEACLATAALWIELGAPQQGLVLLESPAASSCSFPQSQPRLNLLRAKALALLGQRYEAQGYLEQASQQITHLHLPYLWPRAEAVHLLLENNIRKI